MDKQKFQEILRQLHEAIETGEEFDEDSRQLLEHLADDIQQALYSRSQATEHTLPLAKRLELAIQRYEASHPALTRNLAEILEILSGAGI